MKLFLLLMLFISSTLANPLQEAIDNAPPYSTLKLSKAIYSGNITIDKPLSIVGISDNVIIKGDSQGSVIRVTSANVTLKNLTITDSGSRMDRIDSAISMQNVTNCKIDHCKILNSLYGIDMQMVKNSIFSNNYITSKELDLSLRGNALKIYYSNSNIFKNNTIQNSRDVTLNYSHRNTFDSNIFLNNRFATHLSLSNNNTFKNNTYRYNSVSIMVMGAKDTKVLSNTIESSKGAAGIGIVINGVTNFRFDYNRVRFNAKAIYIGGQEKHRGMKRYINYNELSYNGEAIHFHATIRENHITHNKIFSNIEDIVKDISGEFESDSNVVEFNYWDRYSGFDRDDNNIGDNSHRVYQYADQLWHYNNKVKFFYASPIMTLLNFLSNLAPFVEPNLIFEDAKPIFHSDKRLTSQSL